MRFLLPVVLLGLFPLGALAADAPDGQVHINANQILRGRFTEDRQMKDTGGPPMLTSGSFVVAPTHGLIWTIEKPFPTSTIITPNGFVQDIGGLAVKLPAKKNLRHLYDTVSAALAGDWSGLDKDFIVTRGGNQSHWVMLLTPRPEAETKIPYTSISVSGSRYVENIVMMKADGGHDIFNFSDAALSEATLSAKENLLFNEGQQ